MTAHPHALDDAALVSVALAHELQNSLAVVASSLYLARRDRDDATALSRHLDASSRELDAARSVIRAVLRLARGTTLVTEAVDAAELVARARSSVRVHAAVELRDATAERSHQVRCDDVLAVRAIANLLQNSVEALGERGGVVEVTAAREGERVVIAVEDDGPGVEAAVRDTLFEPTVTTKALGTGVGLPFVRVVMRAHGGEAKTRARLDGGRGARFELWFPAADAPTAS